MKGFPATRRSVMLASRDPDPEIRRAAFSALDAFAVDGQRAASRLKRGGGAALQSLDFAGADEELARQGAVSGVDMEE